jgi:hypothetical protein
MLRRELLRAAVIGLVCAALAGGGYALAGINIGSTTAGIETLTKNGTLYRTVTKITKGKVITLPGGTKVVHVPAVVIHARGQIIHVPAHNLKIHRVSRIGDLVSALVAEPMVPVTVTVEVPTTVLVPTTVTETTPPVTVTDTITVTVPLTETSGPDPD